MTTIFDAQLRQLFAPLNPTRVALRDGMSYLETWDVIAHLTRIFGPLNWDKEVKESELIFEEQRTGAKTGWDVAYRATVRLTVRTIYMDDELTPVSELVPIVKVSEDVATGSAKNQPSRADAHDLALKSAVSDALKRAAKDLGNQLGLSLYDGGSLNSVVSASLAHPHLAEKPPGAPQAPSEPEPSPEDRRAATEAAQAPYRGNPDPPNPFPPLEGEVEQPPLVPPPTQTTSDLATPKQRGFATGLLKGIGIETEADAEPWFEQHCPPWPGAIANMSKKQASAVIQRLRPNG